MNKLLLWSLLFNVTFQINAMDQEKNKFEIIEWPTEDTGKDLFPRGEHFIEGRSKAIDKPLRDETISSIAQQAINTENKSSDVSIPLSKSPRNKGSKQEAKKKTYA